LVLGPPDAGRTIPLAFVCDSEKTIHRGLHSRNPEHPRLFRQVKDLLGGQPLVFDREFSYPGLFEALEASGIRYVIRLNGAHRPTITDEEGRRVALFIRPGQKVLRRNVIYLGKVKGNLAGYWAPGLEEPVWVFSNLEPEKALEIYRSRMKIEQSFRDLKGLLGLEKVMSKKLENLEKWIAFMLLAYAVGLLIGETIRDEVYRGKKAPGLLGAFYPPQAPAPAEAQAIFEAYPAGPGPVQGHRPRPCPISCLKVRIASDEPRSSHGWCGLKVRMKAMMSARS
jgi:Transposase DDE domain.